MLLTLALALVPQWGAPQTFDPVDFDSPSGNWRLHIVPATCYGKGPADYELFHDGRSVWSAELDFALREVAVSNAGVVVGHAKRGAEQGLGDFVVAAIDSSGKLLFEERTPFTWSHYPDSYHNPAVRGLVPDFEHDRFFVRIADEDINRSIQSWWAYRASTGERLETLEPELAMAESAADAPASSLREIDAAPLAGTDLFLVSWWRTDHEDDYRNDGVFTLMQADGSIVWRLDLVGDYTIIGDQRATYALRQELLEQSPILGTDIDGHFELRFVKDAQRVHLQAIRDDEATDGWRVEELAREAFEPPPKNSPTVELTPTEIELPVTSTHVLEQERIEERALMLDVRAWSIEADGGFLVVRATDNDGSQGFVRERLDPTGALIDATPLEALPSDPDEGYTNWQALGSDTWLVTRTSYGENERREFYALADGATGELFELDALANAGAGDGAAVIDHAALLPNGNLVALGTYRFESALFCMDRSGRVLWSVYEDYEDETKIDTPEDVTVTTDGLIAVLEVISNRIQVFELAGQYVRSLDLEALWEPEPGYVSGISADAEGGVLVQDIGGAVRLWQMDLEGAECRPIELRYPDGRSARELGDELRMAPDGELWTSDGFTLLRLDDSGLVVETLGPELDRHLLHEPGPTGFLPDGRVCILDKRTGALHVWNERGKLLFAGGSEPGDAKMATYYNHILSDSRGALWAEVGNGKYLGWTAEGKRLGLRDFGGSVAFVPGSENYWVWGRGGGASLRSEAGVELANVERHSGGRWIRGIARVSFGPGAMVYIRESESYRDPDDESFVVGCSPKGEVLGAWRSSSREGGVAAFTPGRWWVPDEDKPIVLRLAEDPAEDEWLRLTGPISETTGHYGISSDGQALLSLDLETMTLYRRELPGAKQH